jgi:hypothetical protein
LPACPSRLTAFTFISIYYYFQFVAASSLFVRRFNTYAFGGKKYVIVSTVSWLGGRNDFLGVAFLGVGGASFLFSLILLVLQLVLKRQLGDTSRLSWNRPNSPAKPPTDDYRPSI